MADAMFSVGALRGQLNSGDGEQFYAKIAR